MRIKTNKTALLDALARTAKALPNKTSQPITECFHLEVADGRLMTTATDGNITITSYEPMEGEGKACLHGRMLLDIVRALPEGDVTLTTDGTGATVDWNKGYAALPSFPVEDYPVLGPEPKGGLKVMINSKLKAALKATLPHTADDEIRPAMMGVYFKQDGARMDAVASDSHTLMLYPFQVEDQDQAEPFILHGGAAAIVRDYVADDEGTTMVSQDDNFLFFYLESHILLRVRKVVGKFPDYTRVVPSSSLTELAMDRGTLLSAIQRVSVCSDKASRTLKMDIGDFGMKITAQDLGFSVSAEENVQEYEFSGEPLTIGFRADLLIKTLSSLNGDRLTMRFNGHNRAALFTCEGDPAQAVVMPVMVK